MSSTAPYRTDTPSKFEYQFNLVNWLNTTFPGKEIKESVQRGELAIRLPKEILPDVLKRLKSEKGYRFLMDICGVHYPDREFPFESVYHLYNDEKNQRLRLKVPTRENEQIPTACGVYRAANWFEREAYDMIGLRYENHPNLTRILTHHQFGGHPLRKDYPAEKHYVLDKSLSPEEMIGMELEQNEADPVLGRRKIINIGPSHPATHGTFRIVAEMEGEIIKKSRVELGYLHRCFEKMCETHTYNQVIPYTDRLNYCSAPINNVAWAMTIEQMMGLQIPKRAQYMRVILMELSRIIDHIVCIGAMAVDSGALTGFWYAFQGREKVYDLFDKLCGARMLTNLTRIGGMVEDFHDDWLRECLRVTNDLEKEFVELDKLLTNNKIFVGRTKGCCPVPAEMAVDYGFTGPCLRASGVPLDLRKRAPYYDYDHADFDIPVGANGDTYDRYLVRLEEVFQSISLIRQYVKNLPAGPYIIDHPLVSLPPKQEVYTNIEALMNHFKLVMHGVRPPKGDTYDCLEAANGELGFYVVSDGGKKPYRVKCRPPCFAIYQAFEEMIQDTVLPNLVLGLSSLNVIAGELDR